MTTLKFELFVDLGIIMVPDDYNHATHLVSFHEKNRKRFYYYNEDINDVNFSNPSRILKSGDKFQVNVFSASTGRGTAASPTSEEYMAFLATQEAVLTSAQGASLVFEQKRDQLPKGFWYCSFDKKERLWKDSGGDRRVPIVSADSDGDFGFGLGGFGGSWTSGLTTIVFFASATPNRPWVLSYLLRPFGLRHFRPQALPLGAHFFL